MSELERRLLAKLIEPDAITEAWNLGVRAEVFEEPLHQAVWNWTVAYWQDAQMKAAPTSWALTQEWHGYAVLEDVEETTSYLAEKLRERYATNQVQELLRKGAASSVTDPLGTLRDIYSAAYAASEAVAPRLTRVNMAETIEVRRERYARREEYPQGIGVTYGLDLVNLHTGGLLPGELAVVAARAKMGKTMFLLNAAADAVRKGYKPIVYTLEISLEDTQERLDAMFSGVSYNRLSKGQLSIDETQKLWAAQEELAKLGGIQVERPEEGERTVSHLLARARQYGADYVLIDQLSFMEPGQRTDTLKEHHATIVKALKNEITRAGQEVPCLLAAQLRRGDEEISLESLSNATEIEQTADIVFGLWRNQDLRNNHSMALDILGTRRSDTARWILLWELTEATVIRVEREVR